MSETVATPETMTLPHAPIVRRLAGCAIDYALAFFLSIVFALAVGLIFQSPEPVVGNTRFGIQAAFMLLFFAWPAIFFHTQHTLGQKVMGLKIVDEDDQMPVRAQIWLRSFLTAVMAAAFLWIPPVWVPGIGYLLAFKIFTLPGILLIAGIWGFMKFHPDHQTPQDWLCNTRVILNPHR